LLGLLILAMRIPPVAKWYFIDVQRLKAVDLPIIYATVIAFTLCPLTVCLRARLEGLVAFKKKPGLFLTGQIVYLITLTTSGLILSSLRFSGNLLGPIGFIAANLITATALHYLLISGRKLRDFKKAALGLIRTIYSPS
jgi:predicted PurR-regulated permease PerM